MFQNLARKRTTDALKKKKNANVKKWAEVIEIIRKKTPNLGTVNHRKHTLLTKSDFYKYL